MTDVEVKNEAKRNYLKRDYLTSFEVLNQLPTDDLLQYAQGHDRDSNKWLTDPLSGDVFWSKFLLRPDIFSKFFESDKAHHLLHLYFTELKKTHQDLLQQLALSHPELLVNSIRLSSAFLNDRHFNSFGFFKNSESSYLQLHYNVFESFRRLEASLWSRVEEWSESMSGYVLNTALFETTLWLESKYFEAKFNLNSLHHLSSVYNTFIEWFSFKRKSKLNAFIKNFSEKSLDEKFYDLFDAEGRRKFENITGKPIFGLLNDISNWVDFKESILSSYCHDLNYSPHLSTVGLELRSDPESYYKWKLNGERYFLTHFYYVLQSTLFVEEGIENGVITIPRKESPYDYAVNKELCVNNYATAFFLEDLCIETFNYKKREIPVSGVFRPLQALSANRTSRIEALKQQHFEKSKSWYDMYQLVLLDSAFDRRRREPFWCPTTKEFIQQTRAVFGTYPYGEGELEAIIEMESYDLGIPKDIFDRFNIRYNVFFKPFLNIGDSLFSPIVFLANNFVFYNIAQLGLRQTGNRGKTKKETSNLEQHLTEIFERETWKVTRIKDEQSNLFEGDVDLIIDDGVELLFIQLKRTYFRLNLKDAYLEEEIIDKHAAEQLNEADANLHTNKFLQETTGIQNGFRNKKVTKWIVSTSLEACGSVIKGCNKVNYFELIAMLKLNPTIKLSEFISMFEDNRHLKKLGLVTEVFSTEAYKRVLDITNKELMHLLNKFYQEGTTHIANGESVKAQISFSECVKLYPEDSRCWHQLANAYADSRNYTKAFNTFDKALEISPKDPMIWLDKANCLWENLQNREALIEFLKIFKVYRLLQLEETIEELFKRCTENGLLAEQEYLKLKMEFDELRS